MKEQQKNNWSGFRYFRFINAHSEIGKQQTQHRVNDLEIEVRTSPMSAFSFRNCCAVLCDVLEFSWGFKRYDICARSLSITIRLHRKRHYGVKIFIHTNLIIIIFDK